MVEVALFFKRGFGGREVAELEFRIPLWDMLLEPSGHVIIRASDIMNVKSSVDGLSERIRTGRFALNVV
jgi:hypothetical protein